MALFGLGSDIGFFRQINRELIHDIVSTYVDILQMEMINNSNIYGESTKKIYKQPIRLSCLIQKDDQDKPHNEFGIDLTQTIKFSFLRDDLKDINLVIQEGDIIHWNNQYWEVSKEIENKFYMNRNPETNKELDEEFGWNISIVCSCHLMRSSKIDIEQIRSGKN